MNTHISSSIIMRTWEFGETDLLVSFFTHDKGRLKGVAKGARKSRKRFSNCLDLFCLISLEFGMKTKGNLNFIHSGKLIEAFPGLRSDFSSLSLASYMVEITEILFPLGVVDKRMFDLLKNSFFALNKGEKLDQIRIFFDAKAMALGGYGINLEKCCNCGRHYIGEGRAIFKRDRGGISCMKCGQESSLSPGLGPNSVKLLKELQSFNLDKQDLLVLTDDIISEVKSALKLHIEYRIGKRLKSAKYLE